MQTCTKCKLAKELEEFNRSSSSANGRVKRCKKCIALYTLNRRRYSKKHIFHKHYTLMVERVLGTNPRRTYSVEGMPILSKEEYAVWLEENMDDFDRLQAEYEREGFSKPFAPSIDRIDNKKSYVADNMRWLVNHANLAKGDKV